MAIKKFTFLIVKIKHQIQIEETGGINKFTFLIVKIKHQMNYILKISITNLHSL